ncbi:hypothetical protein SmJEL517_g01209 [Synchytrium microbalum]|uniref:RNA helicase n=1 Tax=Synchytrium microbalum TaxID=1806994 RepID=A0A507CB68_9FUNG|nr:uncharacterized protein SmJEL517_g01209 [Synchytrium microbalum]TPX36711.1 hypothetical protein SmJEL517_g01209 [Synchytrium microbalum]
MADKAQQATQYGYTANSNLVLQADRSALPRRDQEPSGESETLYGKIDPKKMGDRAQRTYGDEKARIDKKRKDREDKLHRQGHERELKKGKSKADKEKFMKGHGLDVLAATEDLEGVTYRPRTKDTAQTHQLMLYFMAEQLGDVPQDVIKGATDEVIQILKEETAKDFDKKRDIERLLQDIRGSATVLSSEKFAHLVGLGKKITDYRADEAAEAAAAVSADTGARKLDTMDDEYGVAVVFDEEEEDEDSDDEMEIKDDDDDEEEDEGQDAEATATLRTGNRDDEDEEGDENADDSTIIIRSQKISTRASGKSAASSSTESTVLKVHDVDAFWLQRMVVARVSNVNEAQDMTDRALRILETTPPSRLETQLLDIFGLGNFELVKLLISNRHIVLWCTRLAQAQTPEAKATIEARMRELGLDDILGKLASAPQERTDDGSRKIGGFMDVDMEDAGPGVAPAHQRVSGGLAPRQILDLESLVFSSGGHLMSNKKVKLPEGSFKRSKKGYEEVHVPAPKKTQANNIPLVPITDLPEWARPAFTGTKDLNPVQSKVFPTAFYSDENLLLCAPTGAGKTNVAMLTMLHEIGKHINPSTGKVDLDNFKIVYVAPMKALVQEMVGNFGLRLSPYGINVAELSGDRQLTKQQIAETQIIITTPEKWDIITRKATDRSYTNLVRLVIVDEIHLLHDERGPVLEAIVARTLRTVEQTQQPCRLVGLSATLPNYVDVAAFLRVDMKTGLFFFDGSFRPCPLKQQYIGITEKKATKRFQTMNEIAYEKVMEEAGKNQVLIFCHSRKETAKTAKALRDMALEKDTLMQILPADEASRRILQEEAPTVKNADLADILPYGFAIHHAGMTRADRTLVEDLFAGTHVKVLVSTATLAWGVNLPAHTVIIKGTQIYSPEKGRWVELSPQDILQMLGRAGRPQFDTFGEGIIITTNQELQYYLSLLNEQLPIESQLVSKLADTLNAEIVLGSIRNRDEAVQWLGYTYLYVRMLRNCTLYGISPDELKEDPVLLQHRVDLIHSAATVLDKHNLLKYDRKTGKFQVTELGRIAAHFYISHSSMATYNQHLKPTMSLIDLFRVFALSDEFKYIPVREEEKLELSKLLERVPIPVKEGIEEPTAKINVLLQAYISQLKLEGFALMSDMVYVTQSAGRILRAIFEICLKRGWAQLSRKALDMCKMVEKHMWLSMSPLRQFLGIPSLQKNVPQLLEIIKRFERKEFPWERYYDLNPQELGEFAGMPKAGNDIHRLVHQFPKLEIDAKVSPISRSMLKVELTITPDFQFDDAVHSNGLAESFWIFVEDADSENILFHDTFLLKKRYAGDAHQVDFYVPLYEPLPPNYFISVISDRWLHSEVRLPVSFKHLILPDKYPPHTELLDLQPLAVSALKNPLFERLYKDDVDRFNPIQTQVFNSLYNSDDNVLVGAPAGSGKTICAEFALLRLWAFSPRAHAVYMAPYESVVETLASEWKVKFGSLMGGKNIVTLTGDVTVDLKLLEKGDVIFTTPECWDNVSRRWKKRQRVQKVGLFIIDEIHLIGGSVGPVMEQVVSRMRYVAAQLGEDKSIPPEKRHKMRFVALSASLANARDVGEWIGAPPASVFNFHPNVRPVPLEIHIQGYNVPHFPSLMITMAKPTYLAITQLPRPSPTIIFVPSRKQCSLTANELLIFCAADDQPRRFLHVDEASLQPYVEKIDDKALAEVLPYGIGIYHEGLSKKDKKTVESLYETGALQLVIASREMSWGMSLDAHLVVVMGTQYYEGREHRYSDYPIADVLQMMGRASKTEGQDGGLCVLMCQAVKKDFYKKFLFEALPVESHLDRFLHDFFNAEVDARTIENKQDAVDYMTWTFLYRRMALNPNYYGMQGASHRHLSEKLSDLVESTLEELATSKCISVEGDDVSPVNLGMVAAYYYVHYATIETFALSLKATTKLRGLLEIVSHAAEYETIPIRHHEETVLNKIHDRLPVKLDKDFTSPHTKTNLLLQAHFSRIQLPADLESDQKLVLKKILSLIQACVDVISSAGWLPTALAAMELSQMCVQAMWDRDSALRQVPHLTSDAIERLKALKVETVYDLIEMDDDDRVNALQIDDRRLMEVARFTNRYPNIDVSFEVDEETVAQGGVVTGRVKLVREGDDNEEEATKKNEVGPVIAPFYPSRKDESWWLVVGDPRDKTLLWIKRTTLQWKADVKMEFVVPDGMPVGKAGLQLFLMCDSYSGCDQEFELKINVTEGEGSEDEDGMEVDG